MTFMKIIKRSGTEVQFDITKIVNAITKANMAVLPGHRLTEEQISRIADKVEQQCADQNHTVSVEEIQDMVEDNIMAANAYEVARHYITYRNLSQRLRQAEQERFRDQACRDLREPVRWTRQAQPSHPYAG